VDSVKTSAASSVGVALFHGVLLPGERKEDETQATAPNQDALPVESKSRPARGETGSLNTPLNEHKYPLQSGNGTQQIGACPELIFHKVRYGTTETNIPFKYDYSKVLGSMLPQRKLQAQKRSRPPCFRHHRKKWYGSSGKP
jgi:hypothetical protein